jgi:hypothetical protein
LHRSGIEFPIRLGPWPPNRWTFAPIENPELNSSSIRHTSHQAVECIDLADEMALPKSPYGGIARHCPDGLKAVRHEGHLSPHASRASRSLAACVPASHHNHIECRRHGIASSSAVEWGQKARCFT